MVGLAGLEPAASASSVRRSPNSSLSHGHLSAARSKYQAFERVIQYGVAWVVEQGEGMSIASRAKRITTNTLQEMKANKEKIAMLTAYDYSLARLVDSSGIDVILVGDSASNVMAGHETTVPITLDQMIYHARVLSGPSKEHSWW